MKLYLSDNFPSWIETSPIWSITEPLPKRELSTLGSTFKTGIVVATTVVPESSAVRRVLARSFTTQALNPQLLNGNFSAVMRFKKDSFQTGIVPYMVVKTLCSHGSLVGYAYIGKGRELKTWYNTQGFYAALQPVSVPPNGRVVVEVGYEVTTPNSFVAHLEHNAYSGVSDFNTGDNDISGNGNAWAELPIV